jgi:hypothetical protein
MNDETPKTPTITRATMHGLLEREPDHDWLQYLKPSEFATDERGKQHPKVIGLRRLANIRGIKDMDIGGGVTTIKTAKIEASPMAWVTVRIEFEDGAVSSDGADCHRGNCSLFGHHPFSTAVTRATGRAIARAFNIERVSEEMDPLTAADTFADPASEAEDMQKSVLKSMAKTRKLDLQQRIDALFPGKNKTIDNLTSGEATQLTRYINDRKSK